MSAVAILQETLPFDFETGLLAHTEEDHQTDVALCKSYFFRWASAYGSDQPAAEPIAFEEFQAAAKRLAR